jgi:AraC-like DNA-binding protein
MDDTGTHIEMTGPLSGAIKYFYCIQAPADFETKVQHLSPNLEMMLIFNFGAPVRISFGNETVGDVKIERVAAIGPLRKMLSYEILPGADIIVTVFNPDGFYRLFQLPMDEMNEPDIIDPDRLLNITGFNNLWKALNNLSQLSDRIGLLEAYALAFVRDAEEAVSPLVDGIPYFHNPIIQPVRAIASDSNLSERTIQLRFKKYLGFSPKELLRFLRFKQVINGIMEKESMEVDWYELVNQYAYHDQSHLIKDFQYYLGTTPRKFVKEIAGKEFCVSRPGKYYS